MFMAGGKLLVLARYEREIEHTIPEVFTIRHLARCRAER